MPPTGPRTRRPEAQQSSRAGSSRSTADRNDVFESIFGRSAGGHHAQGAGQNANASHPPASQPFPPHVPHGYTQQVQTGYEAFAPPLPPPAPDRGMNPVAGPSNYGRYQQSGDTYAGGQKYPGPGQQQRSTSRSEIHGQGYAPQAGQGVVDPHAAISSRRTSSSTNTTASGADPSMYPGYAQPIAHPSSPSTPRERDYPVSRRPTVNTDLTYPERPRNVSEQSSHSASSGRTATQGFPGEENVHGQRRNGGSPFTGEAVPRPSAPPSSFPSHLHPMENTYAADFPSSMRYPEADARPSRTSSTTSRNARSSDFEPPSSSRSSAAPTLPDIVSDIGGLHLFGDMKASESPSQYSGGQPTWPMAQAPLYTQAMPGRMRAEPSYVASTPASPGGPRSVDSDGHNRSYEDELRDQVYAVPRPDQYGRTHRRQMSDSSVRSSSTVQSAAGTSRAGRNGNFESDARYEDQSPGPPSQALFSESNGSVNRIGGRPSIDSVRSTPQVGIHRGNSISEVRSVAEHRALSFSGSTAAKEMAVTAARAGSLSRATSRRGMPPTSYHSGEGSPSGSFSGSIHGKKPSMSRPARKTPLIYPAYLSRVADLFQQMIPIGDRLKDGLTYSEAFDGRDAVELIMDIIRTQDRNLALIIGRSLDSQKFFHDVTYMHKLRDSSLEVYRFRERIPSPFSQPAEDSPGLTTSDSGSDLRHRPSFGHGQGKPYSSGSVSAMTSISSQQTHSNPPSASPSTATTPATSTHTLPLLDGVRPRGDFETSGEDSLPQGIFTLLTNCYSPTCSRDSLCYSVNCPRRPEQQRRLNLKVQPVLTRKLSEESLGEVKETGTLWSDTVSEEVRNSVSVTEQRRQEAINELIYTERDFVRDMEYLRDSWIKPLRTRDIVPQAKREEFVVQVFWNIHDILGVNGPLATDLTKRQKHSPVIANVGDILLQHVPKFGPFVNYGSHQLFAKYEFEKEKSSNPVFAKFVDDTERDPSSRKLELNGYLTKPTTRLAKLPLLLEAILKSTAEDSQDKQDLPEVLRMVREYLTKVNLESGRSENLFNLAQLDQQLVFRPGEHIDLHLRDRNREIVYKGPLKCRGGPQGENADLQVFLFDHALLMVKPKLVNKHEQYKVYRKPIPLELLVLTSPDEMHNNKLGSIKGRTLVRNPPARSAKDVVPKPESKHGYSLTLIHLGRKGYSLTLWVPTYAGRKKWLEHIETQQQILRDRSRIFDSTAVNEHYFNSLNKLNCAAPYDQGRRMIYGTDEGVYFSNFRDERLRTPTKVLAMTDVTQVDVLEEYQLLVVLAERSVTAFPLEALDPTDPQAALKRGKRLSSHTSFFKTGVCLGRTLLCIVKSSPLSSTIKTLEALDQSVRGKKQPAPFRKFLNNANEPFKVFKEFYIPTESSGLSFLKTRLCVATTRGFEVVDLETLDTQGLLDPSDSSLDFVSKRENVHPIAIYRIEEHFLLCYAEFAFYVNKTGWRARPRWAIQWEGYPTAFALHYPYVIAFEHSFVEIRHVETGNLVQIIIGNNIRCLFADVPPSTVHAPTIHVQAGAQGGPAMQFHPQFGFQPVHQATPQARGPLRNQIVFASEEGNVYFLQLAPTKPVGHGPSTDSGSIRRR